MSMNGDIAEEISQILELESVEEKDQIIADILKNGRQVLVKYQHVLIPEVYSVEIKKSNDNSPITAAESSEETPLLKLIKRHVCQQWEIDCQDQSLILAFINKVKDENNDQFESILRRTAEYGSTYTKSSSILAIVLQMLFQGIDDDCLRHKDVFTNLWNSITSHGLKACNEFADYIAGDDLKEQLDDPVSPLFQALRMYYLEKLPELFKKHTISDTRELYSLAIDNVTKNGWLAGIESIKAKIAPVKYKQLLDDITASLSVASKPTDTATSLLDRTHTEKQPKRDESDGSDSSDGNDSSGSEEQSTSPFKARAGFTEVQNACQIEALKLHNSLRARHGVPALVLDDAINRKAQAYAEYLANTGRFQHSSDRNGLGENLYTAWSSASVQTTGFGTKATQSWYDEIKQYNFNRQGFSMSTGHFTQVVWKSTNKLGMGIAFADGGHKVLIVAQYGPAGNVMGQFPQNVPPPR